MEGEEGGEYGVAELGGGAEVRMCVIYTPTHYLPIRV